MDVGPHRDLIAELATAVRNNTSLKFGLYHSLFEWFNPMYLSDKAKSYEQNSFVVDKVSIQTNAIALKSNRWQCKQKLLSPIGVFSAIWMDIYTWRVFKHIHLFQVTPEMKELVNAYEPEIFWSDGDGDASVDYWQSTSFLAWYDLHFEKCVCLFDLSNFVSFGNRLYNESPVRKTVVTNDRWGVGSMCKHGGFYTCDDRYNPGIIYKDEYLSLYYNTVYISC